MARSSRRPWTPSSAPYDHDLEVFTRNDHSAVFGAIKPANERQQIISESLLVCGIKRGECFQHRPVIVLEDLEKMFRRSVAKHEMASLDVDGCRGCCEHLAKARLSPPQRGRL